MPQKNAEDTIASSAFVICHIPFLDGTLPLFETWD